MKRTVRSKNINLQFKSSKIKLPGKFQAIIDRHIKVVKNIISLANTHTDDYPAKHLVKDNPHTAYNMLNDFSNSYGNIQRGYGDTLTAYVNRQISLVYSPSQYLI